MPTRNGRNAMLFTYNGTMNMKNKKWENDFSPIDPDGCDIDIITSTTPTYWMRASEVYFLLAEAALHGLVRWKL